MNLRDLLVRENIDPKTVLVLRHTPPPKLAAELPRLAMEEPDVFNAYQQTQTRKVEREMQAAKYVAAFIGEDGNKALFVGLY